MSEASWLVAGMAPGVDRQPLKKFGPDPNVLLRLVERWRDDAVKAGKMIERIALAFEAGRDGFWLARWLQAASAGIAGWSRSRRSRMKMPDVRAVRGKA